MSLTVYDRKGNWHVRGTVNGRLVRQSLGTRDRKKAEEKKAELEARLWKGDLYGEESIATFEDAALAYLRDGGETRFVEPLLHHFKGRLLSKIKPVDVREAARVIYPDASPATWNRQAISPARAIINHAADNGMCPAIRIKQFPVDKPKRQSVNMEWIAKFRKAARELDVPHMSTLCLYLFETGCRISEATRLRPQDIDMEECQAYLGKTKNGEEYYAYFSEAVRDEIAQITPRNGRVFRYMDRSGVYSVWKKVCAKAAIDYVPPHQAGRHSLATMLNSMGWTASDIAVAGRWRSTRLVQDTYVHADNRGKVASGLISTELAQLEAQAVESGLKPKG